MYSISYIYGIYVYVCNIYIYTHTYIHTYTSSIPICSNMLIKAFDPAHLNFNTPPPSILRTPEICCLDQRISKATMTGNGNHSTYKNGDNSGMDYDIV